MMNNMCCRESGMWRDGNILGKLKSMQSFEVYGGYRHGEIFDYNKENKLMEEFIRLNESYLKEIKVLYWA